MPWCADCDRYLSPSTVLTDGTCPTCGRSVEQGEVAHATAAAEEEDVGFPWHLKLLLVAVVLYLGWRFVQMIGWLV